MPKITIDGEELTSDAVLSRLGDRLSVHCDADFACGGGTKALSKFKLKPVPGKT